MTSAGARACNNTRERVVYLAVTVRFDDGRTLSEFPTEAFHEDRARALANRFSGNFRSPGRLKTIGWSARGVSDIYTLEFPSGACLGDGELSPGDIYGRHPLSTELSLCKLEFESTPSDGEKIFLPPGEKENSLLELQRAEVPPVYSVKRYRERL